MSDSPLTKVLSLTRWALRLLARCLLMVPAVILSTQGVLEGTALWMSVGAACVAVVASEHRAFHRFRPRAVLVAWWTFTCVAVVARWLIIQVDFIPSIIGATQALWAQMAFGYSLLMFLAVFALRLLARMSTVWFAVETVTIALAIGSAFFPHQYRIIMRPLWFSDLAWSYGIRPADALGFVGAALGAVLVLLTVAERSKRLHPSALLLPLVPLMALLFIDPLELKSPPPPEELQSIKDGFGKPEKRNGSGGNGSESEQHSDSGASEKSGGAQGQSSPVALLRLHSDYESPSQYYYLRQEAYESLSGFRLSTSTKGWLERDWFSGFPSSEAAVESAEKILNFKGRQSISADVALLTKHTTPFGVESPVRYVPTLNPRPGQFDRTYIMKSAAFVLPYTTLFGFDIGAEDWSNEVWEHLTELPADERYGLLAESIIEGLPIDLSDQPVVRAFAIKLWLDRNMKYTRSVKHENATDPTASFLFSDQNQYTGYCVHSAHAAVYLWRSIGIPARVAVGYAVSAEQRKGASIMVLDSDAHSWPELYIRDLGWVPLDIAPETNLEPTGDPPDMAMLELLEELLESGDDSDFRPEIDWAEVWAIWKPRIIGGAITATLLSLIGLYSRKLMRRYRALQGEPRFVYIAALDQLAELGVVRQHGESRERFAKRVKNEPFIRITWAFLQQHLDRPDRTSRSASLLRAEFTKSMALRAPRWRRVLGWLNPFTPFSSR